MVASPPPFEPLWGEEVVVVAAKETAPDSVFVVLVVVFTSAIVELIA